VLSYFIDTIKCERNCCAIWVYGSLGSYTSGQLPSDLFGSKLTRNCELMHYLAHDPSFAVFSVKFRMQRSGIWFCMIVGKKCSCAFFSQMKKNCCEIWVYRFPGKEHGFLLLLKQIHWLQIDEKCVLSYFIVKSMRNCCEIWVCMSWDLLNQASFWLILKQID
jgi:hypothetical protein